MKNLIIAAGIWMLFGAMPIAAFGQELCAAQVPTNEGAVTGMKSPAYPVCEYKGIPYAMPPVGNLRWKAPQPAAKRSETFQAIKFGPSCLQNESFSGGGQSESFSEDCLYLNIYRPIIKGTQQPQDNLRLLPVMFWIHGGGFTQGAGSYTVYEGAHLASVGQVVVVTINYRLDAFGFLALPSLAAEDANHSTGNYGMADQIAALKWVRDNIASFGGDPNQVTIFGESAGGVSVCNLLASKPAAGLFQRGIIESGACDMVGPLDQGFEQGKRLAESRGCAEADPLPCLRAKSGQELLKTKGSGFKATARIDGYVLEASPIELLKKGDYNRVPMLVGNNRDEANIILMLIPGAPLASRKYVQDQIRDALGKRADEVMGMYSFDDYRRPIFLTGAIFADGFGSRAFAAAEELSARAPVYLYRFDWHDEFLGGSLGAFHGLELPFVFGNLTARKTALHIALNRKAIKSGTPLSEKMMKYWTNFAKTGDPNGAGLPAWPKYDRAGRQRIHFDNSIGVVEIAGKQLERYQYFAGISMDELGWGKAKEKSAK